MPYTISKSPPTTDYNCIAWAADDKENWWWPDQYRLYYWPSNVPRRETIEAFIQAFGTLGYSVCSNPDFELGYEKVAIYVDNENKPTHAARQLDNGKWTSKIGKWVDVEHDLNTLERNYFAEGKHFPRYGKAAVFLKRTTR